MLIFDLLLKIFADFFGSTALITMYLMGHINKMVGEFLVDFQKIKFASPLEKYYPKNVLY